MRSRAPVLLEIVDETKSIHFLYKKFLHVLNGKAGISRLTGCVCFCRIRACGMSGTKNDAGIYCFFNARLSLHTHSAMRTNL